MGYDIMEIVHESMYASQEYNGEYDHTRKVVNNTGIDIRITDSSGRVKVHKSEHLTPQHRNEPHLIVEEWFRGTSLGDMVDVTPELKRADNTLHANGLRLITKIPLEAITGGNRGLYHEGTNLVIAPYDSNIIPLNHPRLISVANRVIADNTVLTIKVELLDPTCKYGSMYANIGGEVHRIIPRRNPIPDYDGVTISVNDVALNDVRVNRYPLDKLLNGIGVEGVRIYHSEVEALEDIRHPQRVEYLAERTDWLKNKAAIIKEAEERGRNEMVREIEKARREAEEDIRKADEKARKAEEATRKAEEKARKEKTSLFSNILKALGAVVAFVVGIFALS